MLEAFGGEPEGGNPDHPLFDPAEPDLDLGEPHEPEPPGGEARAELLLGRVGEVHGGALHTLHIFGGCIRAYANGDVVAFCGHAGHKKCQKKRKGVYGPRKGQGLCGGFLGSWLKHAARHGSRDFHVNHFVTTFAERDEARQEIMAAPGGPQFLEDVETKDPRAGVPEPPQFD